MSRVIISKKDLPRLAEGGRFFAPGRRPDEPGGPVEFVEAVAGAQAAADGIVYDYSNLRMSLKSVFLPQTEVLCTFDFDAAENIPVPEDRIVVFGSRPCDARAMAQLDKVFGPENKGYNDPYFTKRRENGLVISLACAEPCASCFCTVTGGGPASGLGSDILAHDIGGDVLVLEGVSEKGRDFLTEREGLLSPAGSTENAAAEKSAAAADAAVRKQNENLGVDLLADLGALKKNMDPLFDDGRWRGLTANCIGCGACTYLCPTCYCFDIADEARLYKGRRIRTWDSCQFQQFTKHASGHNPRTNKKERLRQRFMHKFSYAVENNGEVLCVGCGRCVTGCPVNLDIRDVITSFSKGQGSENAN
jgi:ferredoxin